MNKRSVVAHRSRSFERWLGCVVGSKIGRVGDDQDVLARRRGKKHRGMSC